MAVEVPNNRVQETIRVYGDITVDQMLEILETATLDERMEIYDIIRPGTDQVPVISQEE